MIVPAVLRVLLHVAQHLLDFRGLLCDIVRYVPAPRDGIQLIQSIFKVMLKLGTVFVRVVVFTATGWHIPPFALCARTLADWSNNVKRLVRLAGYVRDTKGYLYGVLNYGGVSGQGTVFKVKGTTFALLHSCVRF
jgi:hypothetical protein